MAVKRDYYEVLGVGREATSDEIKRAYRRLAAEHHPDRNPGDPDAESRFKEVAEAYEVLRDPRRRQQYDSFGHGGDPFSGLGGFGDIFDSFFGGMAGGRVRASGPRRGPDLRGDVAIDLRDVLTGAEREVEIRRHIRCQNCHGSGAAPGTEPSTCRECGGTGQVRRAQQTILGQMVTVVTCGACGGAGRVIASPCDDCHGSGRTAERRRMQIKVPRGVEDGMQIRYEHEGEAGERGGPPGDLYVVVNVRPDSRFERDGADLHHMLDVNMVQAALGDTIPVPTLEGDTDLKLPPGTQWGQRFRISGQGLPRLRSGHRGDLYVTVRVVVPGRLTARQRELLQSFGAETGRAHRTEKGFWDRVRDAFTPAPD